LSFGTPFGATDRDAVPSIFDAGDALLLTSGRVSIAAVLDLIGAGEGDDILVPAFNCRAMIEPIVGMSVRPTLYKVHPDLSIDLADVEANLEDRTRALLVVHYFGFPQDMGPIRSFCDRHELLLIEDCAQCFFGSVNGKPPGSQGDYAIASLMKFFPVYDGGCVVSSRHPMDTYELKPGGAKFELKAVINTLERSVEYRRLRPFNWLLLPAIKLKDAIWSWVKHRVTSAKQAELGPNASDGGFEFETRWLSVRMSLTSRTIMHLSSTEEIIGRRRAIYRSFLTGFDKLPGCRPIFPSLPNTVVPYVFPLFVDRPERVFPTLKSQGVPIFRWEDIEDNVCATSTAYSQHLLQFPCHHELRDHEVDWIVDAVKGALAL